MRDAKCESTMVQSWFDCKRYAGGSEPEKIRFIAPEMEKNRNCRKIKDTAMSFCRQIDGSTSRQPLGSLRGLIMNPTY